MAALFNDTLIDPLCVDSTKVMGTDRSTGLRVIEFLPLVTFTLFVIGCFLSQMCRLERSGVSSPVGISPFPLVRNSLRYFYLIIAWLQDVGRALWRLRTAVVFSLFKYEPFNIHISVMASALRHLARTHYRITDKVRGCCFRRENRPSSDSDFWVVYRIWVREPA